jgi:hypothetical protein
MSIWVKSADACCGSRDIYVNLSVNTRIKFCSGLGPLPSDQLERIVIGASASVENQAQFEKIIVADGKATTVLHLQELAQVRAKSMTVLALKVAASRGPMLTGGAAP